MTQNMCANPTHIRTVVHVRRNHKRPYQPAEFGSCLVDYFGITDDFGRIECSMKDNIVYLQPPPPSTPQGMERNRLKEKDVEKKVSRFQHPPFCVARKITAEEKAALPPEVRGRGIDVGVCILLEASDGRLLMTRRAQHMRTFPGMWVPPGGHIEEGETLETAGLRELQEETGLEVGLQERDGACQILGLWESLYPSVVYMGQPSRHHIVVYFHLRLHLTTSNLQQRLKLDWKEVDACLWLTREMAEVVVFGSHRFSTSRRTPITLVDREGVHSTGVLDPTGLWKGVPESGFEVERITTGTRYALKLWLQEMHREESGRQAGHGDLPQRQTVAAERVLKHRGDRFLNYHRHHTTRMHPSKPLAMAVDDILPRQ
ncbi:nucleoside diphosphate-linked moiety X motif 17-like isoform X2 [Panulirus ornatus]|uniref:nucleoside diphosphate-linked moiety X motif 17-like isoform X2 n=1 Tax=Panulirus ornatus TaxID=150431 RepID=UPI003A873EEA